MSRFIEGISQHLAKLVVTSEEFLITGDFNIHVENINNVGTRKFIHSLDEFGLNQHVVDSTLDKGHILGLLFTRKYNTILLSKPVVKDPSLYDLRRNVHGDHKGILSQNQKSLRNN